VSISIYTVTLSKKITDERFLTICHRTRDFLVHLHYIGTDVFWVEFYLNSMKLLK